ncbi:MAG: trypsin-like peptidase domain-containing protein [Patescibacteria group bacterium]
MKRVFFLLAVIFLFIAISQTYNLFPQFGISRLWRESPIQLPGGEIKQIAEEESTVISVIENALPSVVTIGIMKTTTGQGTLEFDPFNPFGGFRRVPGTERKIEQNIGSGFIVAGNGLIITNKHVVADTEATYKVLTNDSKTYNVENIYRDPLNDLALLKISASGLKPLPLGDSTKLKLGQMAVAIGTPLGEFTNTATTGIVSGLGRGITAGSPFEGFVEKLDDVIQTDAAISPGNSGGPLLNSKGEVIGVNTAIAQEGQNIGFAIPVNLVKELLSNFEKRGSSFERPYLGVRYQMIDRKTAIMNDLPEGAYVESVVDGSPAEKAGIQAEDIIVEINGKKVSVQDKQELGFYIAEARVGDRITVKFWRREDQQTVSVILEASP